MISIVGKTSGCINLSVHTPSLWCHHSHTFSFPFFSLFPASAMSCLCCLYGQLTCLTWKQLLARLSIATKRLYIMTGSPAMQRGFMALEVAEWYLLSPEYSQEPCAFAANKLATQAKSLCLVIEMAMFTAIILLENILDTVKDMHH